MSKSIVIEGKLWANADEDAGGNLFFDGLQLDDGDLDNALMDALPSGGPWKGWGRVRITVEFLEEAQP